jgi:hypothetical protein
MPSANHSHPTSTAHADLISHLLRSAGHLAVRLRQVASAQSIAPEAGGQPENSRPAGVQRAAEIKLSGLSTTALTATTTLTATETAESTETPVATSVVTATETAEPTEEPSRLSFPKQPRLSPLRTTRATITATTVPHTTRAAMTALRTTRVTTTAAGVVAAVAAVTAAGVVAVGAAVTAAEDPAVVVRGLNERGFTQHRSGGRSTERPPLRSAI